MIEDTKLVEQLYGHTLKILMNKLSPLQIALKDGLPTNLYKNRIFSNGFYPVSRDN